MSQKNIKWTPQQLRAIEEHARSVFVSASAGTGKTAVLSGSCVDAITAAGARPDVWNILVLTFTDMAADEMRSRISSQLNLRMQACKDSNLKQHLRRQLILLGAADISTIHSFCKRLITEHFYQLNLDPTFRVIDADAAKLLKADALDKTIEWAWNQKNLGVPLRQLLFRRDLRTGDGFANVIIEINDFLDCIVSRQNWLQRAETLANEFNLDKGVFAETQKQFIKEKLLSCLNQLNNALKIYQSKSPDGLWGEKFRNTCILPVRQCLELFNSARWENASLALITFVKPTVYRPKDTPEIADSIKAMADAAFETITGLKDLAVFNPESLTKFSAISAGQTKALIELVRQFDVFYRQAKAAINCLDFADLEHYALLLRTQRRRQSHPGA